MSLSISIYHIGVVLLTIIGLIALYKIFDKIIFPWIVNKRTNDIEVNPKWIVSKLQAKYYGFNDMDIVIVKDPFNMIPRFRLAKHNRLQLLIPEDTSTRDIEDIGRLALAGKLRIKYGVWFPEKPTQWLSILNYMLDGKDIKIESTKWEEDKKPVDL